MDAKFLPDQDKAYRQRVLQDNAERIEAFTYRKALPDEDVAVSKDIEKSENDRGNSKMLRDQIVDHNIPQSFHLTMSIYEGFGNDTFAVEIVVDSNTLEVSLESPQLKELQLQRSDEIMNTEIELIADLLPDLAILNC